MTGENKKTNIAEALTRAALLTRGIEAKSHAGVQKMFNRELTAKRVMPSFNKLLGDIQKARETADYDAAISFSLDEAREVLEEAERFASAVTDLLKKEGWTA